MNATRVWEMIGEAQAGTKRATGDNLRQACLQLTDKELKVFESVFYAATNALDTSELKRLYFYECNLISSDGYSDFLKGVVLKGKTTYDAVLESPELSTLAVHWGHNDPEKVEFEWYVPHRADATYP